MIDNKLHKADLFVSLIVVFICSSLFIQTFIIKWPPRVETVAQVNLCTYKDSKLVRVHELYENLPRYICGTTNKVGEDFHIMIYDSNNQPIWGYMLIDSEETFELRIFDKLSPGEYKMEITGVRKTYDTTDFVILEQSH